MFLIFILKLPFLNDSDIICRNEKSIQGFYTEGDQIRIEANGINPCKYISIFPNSITDNINISEGGNEIMKKLLYIVANSKPEEISSSKTVGRALVNSIMEKYSDLSMEELNLYSEYIPRPKYSYFSGRSSLVSSDALSKLTVQEQNDVQQMLKLCDQFVAASVYVVASPMWSLSFPAVLKDYIDCIIQAEKTITFKNEKPEGLLNDRPRTFIYVQSSGGNIPWIMKPILDKGLNYVEDIIKFIGISKADELLVDGTGTTEMEKLKAIEKAKSKIDTLVDQLQF